MLRAPPLFEYLLGDVSFRKGLQPLMMLLVRRRASICNECRAEARADFEEGLFGSGNRGARRSGSRTRPGREGAEPPFCTVGDMLKKRFPGATAFN